MARVGMARLRDVAKAAGVSLGTASKAFGRPELVSVQSRERVRQAAAALGYRGPDVHGRLLAAGTVNAIGIATAEPLSYFFDDLWARALLSAVSDACDARGAGIALVSALNRERLAWNLDTALVDGFVLLCAERGELLVELTRRRGLPFVALALDVDDPDVPQIGIDDFGGTKAAAEHLLGLGHRRLGILAFDVAGVRGGPLTPEAIRAGPYAMVRARAEGYWAAFAAAGLAPTDVPVRGVSADATNVDQAMEGLFATETPPTAILAMSDVLALRAMAWLAARGLRVPADVSVVGFDGVPEGASSTPSLTTVVQPLDAVAGRAIAAIIDGAPLDAHERLPMSLAVRASTAPVPSEP